MTRRKNSNTQNRIRGMIMRNPNTHISNNPFRNAPKKGFTFYSP